MPAVQPAPAMQRRHSSASSSDASSDQGQTSRHTSQENIASIPTRTGKVATSKPVANPLQFVKVGPCDLSRFAQEQLKKSEEVKKVKPEKRDEAEDWQSNLDNWKCSRRKRQEHIIERVVEVKKLELEEHDRNRRRSKTFNEMLEERTSKGRKMSLPVYQDDNNDLSDLGLSGAKANEDDVFHDAMETHSGEDASCSNGINGQNGLINGHSQRESSTEQEEYTYERAIQNYVNYTETRVRGRSLTPSDSDQMHLTNGHSKKPSPPIPAKPRRGSCKIEEKLSELEQIKKKSMSTNDLTENTRRPLSVPKVDILKRREMFEKGQEEDTTNVKNRLSGDFGSKSIRDRVSSFGKPSEDLQNVKKINRLSSDISVRDRLYKIEKQHSVDSISTKSNTSPSDNIAMSQSVKDRLSSLQKVTTSEPKHTKPLSHKPTEKVEVKEAVVKCSVKENVILNSVNLSADKCNISKTENTENDIISRVQKDHIENDEDHIEKSTISPTEDMYDSKRQQHYRHRSLDSLDVESNDGVGNESFERVQSLEDLDFRNYPASSVSGDTDREDSGIHTADVSSSVSQADDCDLHLDAEFHQQPTILEEMNKIPDLTSTLIVKQINQINVSGPVVEIPADVVPILEVGDNSYGFSKLPLRLDCDPLPVILESPSEPFPPFSIADISKALSPESSQNIPPSHCNVTTNAHKASKSVDKSETVNMNSQTVALSVGDGQTSVANSVPVHTSTFSFPLQLSSTEIVHDNKSGAMEISHKIDFGENAVPPTKPEVSVEADYKFEPGEGTSRKTYLIVKVKISNLKSPTELKNYFRP